MNLIDQLKRDEGVRLKPYKDSVDKITIGVGRNLDDVGITVDEAGYLLMHDIDHASAQLYKTFPWTVSLDDVRKGALINMTFNMGIAGMGGFKLFMAAMEAGDYDRAGDEMLKSKWAEQVGSRAHRLSMQIKLGSWV